MRGKLSNDSVVISAFAGKTGPFIAERCGYRAPLRLPLFATPAAVTIRLPKLSYAHQNTGLGAHVHPEESATCGLALALS
jgi:hypothetical protein